jgi:hypothetical protein
LPTSAIRNAAAARWIVSPSGTTSHYARLPKDGCDARGSVEIMTDGTGAARDAHPNGPEPFESPESFELFEASQPFEPFEPGGSDPPVRRTQHRGVSALIAAGMLGLDEALGRKPKEEAPIVVDADGQPVDIDTDGIQLTVANEAGGDVAVSAPALPRSAPLQAPPSTTRRRRAPRRS